jgi:RNA polymerase primary sigma factor
MESEIEDYCREVGSFKILTHEQNAELARKGTRKAREELVNSNLRLVIMWAKRFAKVTRLELEDLIQEGNIGLMKAAKRFDPKKGKFSTTATWWIKSKIRRYIATKSDCVKGPGWHLKAIVRRWRQVAAEIEQQVGRTPTHAEIQEKMKLPKQQLAQIKIVLSLKGIVRLGGGDDEDENGTCVRQLPDKHKENIPGHIYTFGGRRIEDDKVIKEPIIQATMAEIRQTMNMYPHILRSDDCGKEIRVWECRYLQGMTLEETGQLMGITRERVRQIETDALRRMRNFLSRRASEDEVGAERLLCQKRR